MARPHAPIRAASFEARSLCSLAPQDARRCAIAAGAATIYRNYFAPVGGGSRSPDCALLRNPGNGGPAWSFALHPVYKLHLTWRPEVDCDGMR
jgi:hypothetical protein